MRLIVLLLAAWSYYSGLPALAQPNTPEEAWIEFAKQQKDREATGQELLTLLDLIDRFPDDHKKMVIKRLATANGPFYRINGRWDLIDDPAVALAWSRREQEPFEEKVLLVLEAVLGGSTDKSVRRSLAALLYRYGRASGRDYLLNELSSTADIDAAEILALNRDDAALSDIRKVFALSTPSRDLIHAVGRWGPQTTDLLCDGFRAARGNRIDYIQSFPLADRTLPRDVIEQLRQLHSRAEGETKIEAAAALFRCDPGFEAARQTLLTRAQSLGSIPDGEAIGTVLGLGRVAWGDLIPNLRTAVAAYLNHKDQVPVKPVQVESAKLLARFGDDGAIATVVGMLEKMKNDGLADERDLAAVAAAVCAAAKAGTDEKVNRVMGTEFCGRVRAVSKLRALPDRFLPIPSRGLAASFYP